MKLYLDIGNSKIKWSYSPGIVESIFYKNLDTEEVVRAIAGNLKNVKAIICSNVVSSPAIESFLIGLIDRFECEIISPKTVYRTKYLEVCSENYKTLGVDRWLAMNAITKQLIHKEILLVTLGTALTVDHISKDGKHQGGYILPGLSVCLNSLINHTSLGEVSDFKSIEFKDPKLACDTKSAINNGILALYISFIKDIASKHPSSHLVLSGGDAKNLYPLLSSNWLLEPDLVIKGLYLLH